MRKVQMRRRRSPVLVYGNRSKQRNKQHRPPIYRNRSLAAGQKDEKLQEISWCYFEAEQTSEELKIAEAKVFEIDQEND